MSKDIAKLQERETHINMDKTSDRMRIYTTEYNVMKKLDRYVEESDEWKVIEVGRIKGAVVSKTYEAPRKLLTLRKKSVVMSEEARQAAAERMRAYWKTTADDKASDNSDDFFYDDDMDIPEYDDDDSESTSDNGGIDIEPEITKIDTMGHTR